MVCRNCGADLKPGIKYCLECGSYLEEEEETSDEEEQMLADEESTSYESIGSKSKKKRKSKLTTGDYVIYAGLILIMVVSIIVIVVTVIKNDSDETQSPQPTIVTIREDQKVSLDNYTVVVPGRLYSTVQDSFLYVTDNVNYKFSLQNKEDDFEKYHEDHSLLEEQLISSEYEVVSIYDETIQERLFLLYDIKVEGKSKVLYLTKIDDQYTAFGTIEVFENGNWEDALPQIDVICNSITFNNE